MATACNNQSETSTATDSTTIHPGGVTNGSVISTDTSKMDVHNMEQKMNDSLK